MIIGWLTIALMTIMCIIFFSGKGGWLIAGYNTMSKKEKEKYDEKKMCRNSGISLLIFDILFTIFWITIQTSYGKKHIIPISLFAAIIMFTFGIVSCIRTEKNKDRYYKERFQSTKK